jgi:hypothetical protein
MTTVDLQFSSTDVRFSDGRGRHGFATMHVSRAHRQHSDEAGLLERGPKQLARALKPGSNVPIKLLDSGSL